MATIYGTADDDHLTGTTGADTIHGGAGDDTLVTTGGADVLEGGAGIDVLQIDALQTDLTEFSFSDIEILDTGAHRVIGTAANFEAFDAILAGSEDSHVDLTLSTAGVVDIADELHWVENTVDGSVDHWRSVTFDGSSGNDVVTTGGGDDVVMGNGGADTLFGGSGNDTIDGGRGADTLNGGEGDDRLESGDYYDDPVSGFWKNEKVADTLNGGAGNDTLITYGGADVLDGGAGTDTLEINDQQTDLTGFTYDDIEILDTQAYQITGTAANFEAFDAILAGSENSHVDLTLSAAGVVDIADELRWVENTLGGPVDRWRSVTFKGSSGDDVITTGGGDDTIIGNDGADTLTGGSGNDELYGGSGGDTLSGGSGDDTLVGGSGDDVYVVDSTGDVVTESSGEGFDFVRTSLSSHTLGSDIEGLVYTGGGAFIGTGNALDNTIIGGIGNDTLDGGGGNDKLIGGAGNDTYVVDAIGDVVTEASGGGTDTVKTALSAYTLGANIENLIFTGNSAFIGSGNALDNMIAGAAGNDTLNGGAGNDTLIGGAGNDTLIGGAGNDTYAVDAIGDVVTEASGGGTDTVKTTLSTYVLGANVETLVYTGSGSFSGKGNGLDNTITGGIGNDTLDGGAGNDKLIGGAGNDTYVVDAIGDVVTEASGGGTDTVKTTLSTYMLGANVETLVYTGSGSFTGKGNGLDNTITGGIGNDTLDGGAGNDKLIGGAGNDTYVVDAIGDVVTEASGAGADTVKTTLSTYVLGANVETLVYTGSVGFTGTGNAAANALTGGAKNDTLSGLDGDDTLYGKDGIDKLFGGNGNDLLDGGTGNDAMNGGAGDDTYVVDAAGDTITDASGLDTVKVSLSSWTLGTGLETLVYTGSGAFTGTGNTTANGLTGGAKNDTLSGLDGDDTLKGVDGNDRLNGGNGNDTLEGGAGVDRLFGGAGKDRLTGGAGGDTFVYTAIGDSPVAAYDTITDFSAPTGDKIDLSAIDADTKTAGTNEAFVFVGTAAFTGKAGELRFAGGFLQGDVNGDRKADFSIALTGVSTLDVKNLSL